MAKIIHQAANLELINGVKFVDGVSEDVSDEVAAVFLEIPGFIAADGSSAAGEPAKAKPAKAEKAEKKKPEAPAPDAASAPAAGEPAKADGDDDDTTF